MTLDEAKAIAPGAWTYSLPTLERAEAAILAHGEPLGRDWEAYRNLTDAICRKMDAEYPDYGGQGE